MEDDKVDCEIDNDDKDMPEDQRGELGEWIGW